MEDAFEILGVPRSVSIGQQELERRFHEFSKELHPDVRSGDSEKFGKLNSAFGKLRTVSGRLRHYRDLEFPGDPIERAGAMNSSLMDLFSRIGPAVQRAESVTKELRAAKSELAKALLADAIWETRDALEKLGGEVSNRLGELGSELTGIGRLMEGDRKKGLKLLDRCYQAAAFLEKWQIQIRERLVELVA